MANWLPGTRAKQLDMALAWKTQLTLHAVNWNVPPEAVSDFSAAFELAQNIFENAIVNGRTPALTAECERLFNAMIAIMRDIKNRYFRSPPLLDEDFVALFLNMPDTTKTTVPAPVAKPAMEISYMGTHSVNMYLSAAVNSPPDPHLSEWGFRIYYGIMPIIGEANAEKHELTQVPVSGEDLPFSKFTRRKKDRMEFDPRDSGKRVYFCAQYENSKGDKGPWGEMYDALIT